jgi:hypothetical protein
LLLGFSGWERNAKPVLVLERAQERNMVQALGRVCREIG